MPPSSSGGSPSVRRSTSCSRSTCASRAPRRRCTPTSRPPRWPSPIAVRTSVIRRTSTYRQKELLSRGFGAERSCLIDPEDAASTPVRAGDGRRRRQVPRRASTATRAAADPEGRSTTHLGRRQVGQRRLVHADDRADRRQRHHGPRTRVPAEQRADRLPPRPDPGTRTILPGRQAAALLDVADDRAARRQAVHGDRIAGRLDDHHDGPADADEPARPWHDAAAAIAAPRASSATLRRSPPNSPSSTPTVRRSRPTATPSRRRVLPGLGGRDRSGRGAGVPARWWDPGGRGADPTRRRLSAGRPPVAVTVRLEA